MDENKILKMAKRMRMHILDVAFNCNSSAHIGGGLSIVEIMATLYGSVLKYDKKPAMIVAHTQPHKKCVIISYFEILRPSCIIEKE